VQVLVAVDAGTTGVRAIAFDLAGRLLDVEYRELTQSYPAPGLVEHDATEILSLVDATLGELATRLSSDGHQVEAIGITNQRETTVAIDRADGRVLAPAIVWQDRRTATRCAELAAAPSGPRIRALTGLPCDPYFSATKMRWLLDHAPLETARVLGLCTIDTLVAWHLTGGPGRGTYVTDHSNASRTMLYDLDGATWSDELCAMIGIPRDALAALCPSAGVVGTVAIDELPGLRGTPIAGILGDQQAALLGQCCTRDGMVKATFGTGTFVLAHAGTVRPPDVDGLVTTVAWDLGESAGRSFALEGSAFVAGAALQWLVDELGLLESANDVGTLAASVPDANGASFVPAFTGLGSPWWDPDARGSMLGLSRGVTRAHVARAVVEALVFQGRAMLDAMRGAAVLTELRVDGGAASMDLLCQLLADGTGLRVLRPSSVEATALGAAFAAALGTGLCTLEQLAGSWSPDATFAPRVDPTSGANYETWCDAVARTRALAASLRAMEQGAR
jgi:glycerol kinase